MGTYKLYEHTPDGSGKWHYLTEHLKEVGEKAADFASSFGASRYAKLLGLLHDIGKAHDDFQNYLKLCYEAAVEGKSKPEKSVDHKRAGAFHLAKISENSYEKYLSIALLGHHGSMPSKAEADCILYESSDLDNKIVKQLSSIDSFMEDSLKNKETIFSGIDSIKKYNCS